MKNAKKTWIIVAAIALIFVISAVSAALGFMFKQSNRVENTLTKPVVMSQVVETYDRTANEKSSIKLKNIGNIDSFLRLRLVSYWVDEDGNVLGKPSVMPTVSYDTTKWLKDGDTYYFTQKVVPGDMTAEFLAAGTVIPLQKDTFKLLGVDTDAYQVLEIIPEAVQAEPGSAAGDLWNVTVTEGVITEVGS